MALISLQDLKLGFGGPPLLNGVNLQIKEGERVCLLGRNGASKSTLMKLINGDLLPDHGTVARRQSLRVASMTQDLPRQLGGTVAEIIASGLDEDTGWDGHKEIEQIISKMALERDAAFQELSAGLKRRVLLAKALIGFPHILLLDEPTNHLDIDSIKWLEGFIIRYGGTILFVTHDRSFLQNVATRIVELDRGRIINWDCDYGTYLLRREALLDSESARNAGFDKKLAKEEAWIRQGIKARRTRNEGRVRALKKMREEREKRRNPSGNVRLNVKGGNRSGRVVVEAEGVSCGYEGNMVIKNFSTVIIRGDKVGIIGPNGSGKTTLLDVLLGKSVPVEGEIKRGTNLEIAYFDQMRDQLDEEKTVRENVADGNDQVVINGKAVHIIGYLKDFLFSPERAESPVKILSGGERNRLLLARLFTKPSNMIVMDEPTNDLDMETLDILEEMLAEYNGTLLLVSHDRTFINNIVTGTLVFEGEGRVNEYAGGYDDRLVRSGRNKKNGPGTAVKTVIKEKRPRKISFKEKKELSELPEKIETLEAEKERLYNIMASPEFYRDGGEKISSVKAEAEKIEEELNLAYKRWEDLDSYN